MVASETRVCEKKLAIFRHRRHEENENRVQLARRMARARAMEEQQAKDPANFGFGK
jgi:hypothetical protein